MYPGFIDHVNSFRNTVSFLTETALYRYATPHFYTVNDFPPGRRDLRSEVLYSSPWKGGWWRLGDAVRYMLAASMSVLDTAAKYRENLLYNRYQAGRDAIRRFQEGPPFAYVIPVAQRDPQTASLLAEIVRFNGLEVHQANQQFEANGRSFGAGSRVIVMDQPYAALVKELFETQRYPDLRDFPDGPPDLVEVVHGQGRVVLFGFRPQWRGQSHGAYKFLFNSLYYFGELAEGSESGTETARNYNLELWKDLSSSIRGDLAELIEENQSFNSARGQRALSLRESLGASIEVFRTRRLSALTKLGDAVEKEAREGLEDYELRLKNLLVDVQSKDFSSLDFTARDLTSQYELGTLEAQISAALQNGK